MQDVRDLFAYLKTLPAVAGQVREHDLPFPFNLRIMLGGWKFLFLDGQPFEPDPSKSAEWNRGAYLVNGPATARNVTARAIAWAGIIERQRFAGGPDPEGGEGWIPNITQAGIGDYSEQDIARILETGELPDGDSVGGTMRASCAIPRSFQPRIARRWRPT